MSIGKWFAVVLRSYRGRTGLVNTVKYVQRDKRGSWRVIPVGASPPRTSMIPSTRSREGVRNSCGAGTRVQDPRNEPFTWREINGFLIDHFPYWAQDRGNQVSGILYYYRKRLKIKVVGKGWRGHYLWARHGDDVAAPAATSGAP